jgi:threonyl-tRNA synthetase
MIHRTVLGSLERFIGVLLENCAGALPLWLSPVQVLVIPVSEKHVDFADKFATKLDDAGFRVEVDYSNESVGKKIRNAELAKSPYMLVVGDKEADSGKFAVRSFAKGELGTMTEKELVEVLNEEIKEKK